MTQLSIDAILIGQRSTREELTTVNTTRLEELLRRYHIGSWVHSPTSERRVPGWGGPNAREWNEIIGQIQLYSTLIDGVPALYGIDHIHGANFVSGATIFPHQLTSASSFNRALIELMGAITAKDTRAAGIPWVFAPTLDVAVQPAWSRVFETFGECPFVVSELGGALIRGLQGVQDEDGRPAIHRPDKVAATFKNFIGGSNPRNGANGAESWIPDRQLLDLFLPPFSAAIQQHQVASGMLADNSINGVPLATDSTLASRMLRDALSFNGTLVTAPDALFSLQSVHRLTASQHDAISLAMRTSSIDIASMNGRVDEWFDSLLQLVETEVIPVARVNLAAARVLQLKKDLGLATSFPASEIYSKESRAKEQEEMIRTVGSQADRDIALALAHESIVLLQNDGLLPVEVRSRSAASPIRKILVVGPTGDSIARQSGGWTFHRTGAAAEDEFPFGSSIFGGVKRLVKQIADSDDEVSVTYETGVEIDGSYTDEQLSRALKAADEADLVIACLGEDAYAEESGPITSLSLPAGQQHLLSELTRLASRAGATTSKTPSLSLKSLVAVLVQGRPRLLDLVELSRVRAILHAGLLGPEGGQAVADVIFGIVNPSGRLPITYPKHTADQPLQYYHTHSEAGHFAPQWEFGHGLSFTRFEYAELKMSASAIDPNDHLTVSVRVTNVGAVAGQETVLCFLSDLHRIVAPEVKRLRGFEKITLKPRESQVVTFTIGYSDWSFIGVGLDRRTEAGQFQVHIGSEVATFFLNDGPDDYFDTEVILSRKQIKHWWRDLERELQSASDEQRQPREDDERGSTPHHQTTQNDTTATTNNNTDAAIDTSHPSSSSTDPDDGPSYSLWVFFLCFFSSLLGAGLLFLAGRRRQSSGSNHHEDDEFLLARPYRGDDGARDSWSADAEVEIHEHSSGAWAGPHAAREARSEYQAIN